MIKDLEEAIDKREIPISIGYMLAKLPEEKQAEQLQKAKEYQNWINILKKETDERSS